VLIRMKPNQQKKEFHYRVRIPSDRNRKRATIQILIYKYRNENTASKKSTAVP